jgi:eukaryotic-like serine/threonine-protein kinase
MGTSLECGALLHKRYRIVEILGQGGMGSVYRAVDENLGVDVAVKENLFTTDEYARQFRLEAVILANLRHDNLPRVTDHFVIEGQGQYLIMDYIEGEDLRQRMERDGNISGDEAIQIGAAMCDALEYLHTRKPAIIHRDIKPGNVRITPEGHIFLVDFGLAKLVKGGQATTTGARAMTPGYSPPEQYGTARTDPRTDIYSLGATLYAGLSGVIPEDGLARAMDNVELTPLRKRNPIVSRKLANVIEKAMAIRPEDRFQSAQEFKLGLIDSNSSRLELKGEKSVESPSQDPTNSQEDLKEKYDKPEGGGNNHNPLLPSIPQKEPRGARWWVFLAAFLLTILLVTLVSIIILWSPLTKSFQPTSTNEKSTPTIKVENTLQPTFQPLEKTKTIIPTLTATFTQTIVYTASITPTPTITYTPLPTFMGGGNNQIAFVSNRNGAPQLFIMNTDINGPQNQITNLPDGACQPKWSPDGLRLAFISPCLARQDQYPEANIFIINADGSGLTKLMSKKTGDFDPAWSPDGTKIAFTSIRDGSPQIYVLNLLENSISALTAPSNDKHLPDWSYQPAWSPSGTQIIFTGHSLLTKALQIWTMSDAGRGQSLLIHRGDLLWNFLPEWANDGKTILFSETNGGQALGWLMRFDYENQTNDAVHMRAGTFGTHGNYSPDGSLVVFESIDLVDTNHQNYDIYLIKSDGTGPLTRLTNSNAVEFDPVWRPLVKP